MSKLVVKNPDAIAIKLPPLNPRPNARAHRAGDLHGLHRNTCNLMGARVRSIAGTGIFAQDWQTRMGCKTPIDNGLVLIGIDKPVYLSEFSDEEVEREPVLRHLQSNFPWSREVWARLIEKLGDAGAKSL